MNWGIASGGGVLSEVTVVMTAVVVVVSGGCESEGRVNGGRGLPAWVRNLVSFVTLF